METKEKIKLLADLQSAIDNEELKELVEGLPSGEKIFEIFHNALQSELQSLLSGKNSESSIKEQEYSDIIRSLDNSAVLTLLQSLAQKMGATQPNIGGVSKQPDNFREEPPESQDELQKKWESQQLGKGPARGTSTGIF